MKIRLTKLPNSRLPRYVVGGGPNFNTNWEWQNGQLVPSQGNILANQSNADEASDSNQVQQSGVNLPDKGFRNSAFGQMWNKISHPFASIRAQNRQLNAMAGSEGNTFGFTKSQIRDSLKGRTPNLDIEQVNKINSGVNCPDGYEKNPSGFCVAKEDATDQQKTQNSGAAQQFNDNYVNSAAANLRPFEFRERRRTKELVNNYNQINPAGAPDKKVPFMHDGTGQFWKKAGNTFNAIGTNLAAGLSLADNISEAYAGKRQMENFAENWRDNNFTQASAPGYRGNTEFNTGMVQPYRNFNPNEGYSSVVEQGGEISNTMKIRITRAPKMEYGGQAQAYGLDLNQKRVQTQGKPSPYDSISSTLSAVPRDRANIEAEGGETVFGDLDNDGALEHMMIKGKRHTHGGVPLNVPEGSFVFSDTRKMKIKDPNILNRFGISSRARGITPAAIAKKYDVNRYKAIMEDPNADPLSRATAQMMVKNYQKKLAELASVQESLKGYPSGQPDVTKRVFESIKQQPPQIQPQQPYSQFEDQDQNYEDQDYMEQDQQQAPMARYGGNSPLPKYQRLGSYPTPQTWDPNSNTEWQDDWNKLADYLRNAERQDLRDAMYYRYSNDNLHTGKKLTQQQFIDAFLEHQRQIRALRTKYKNTPEMLHRPEWDNPEGVDKNAVYNAEIASMGSGFKPMSEREIQAAQKAFEISARLINNDKDYSLDPAFVQKYKDVFGYNAAGKNDQKITITKPDGSILELAASGADGAFGNTTDRSFVDASNIPGTPQPQKIIGHKCNPTTKQVESKEFDNQEQMQAAGYSLDPAVAAKECQPDEQTTEDPKDYYRCLENGSVSTQKFRNPQEAQQNGYYTSAQEALRFCPGKVPFKATTPDRLNLLGATMLPPQIAMPYSPDLTYNPRPLALEDWQAAAQSQQQMYGKSAETLGNFQPGQALASNLSYMAGQTADNVGKIVAGTTARNVDRYNDYALSEQARKDQVDQYNALNHRDTYDKSVLARQNYRNAWRQHLANTNAAHTALWDNRMKMYMTNMTNPQFYVDPRTGRTIFRNNGYNSGDVLGGAPGGGTYGDPDWKQAGEEYRKAKEASGMGENFMSFEQWLRATGRSSEGNRSNRTASRTSYGPQDYNLNYHTGVGSDFSGLTGMDPYSSLNLMMQRQRGRG